MAREKLTDRVLALLGLDMDFSVSLARDPFNAITEGVFLGARPHDDGVEALKEAGITHVVSCLQDDARDRVAFLQQDFEALFLPLRDGMHENIAAHFPAFMEFVDGARNDEGAKVLVHCEVGVSRSATLVTAWVMRRSGQRFIDAYQQVRGKRPEVLPNIGFASQLQRLEHEMHPRTEEDESLSSLARYLKEVCMAPVDVETLQGMLHDHDYDAVKAIRAIFGDEIPRVIQGVRA